MTGMSARTQAAMASAIRSPPSSLTAAAPANLSINPALRTACRGLIWYVKNGKSATTSARFTPRTTQAVWYCIWASVTGSGVSWPWTTMPRESPTRIASTPASSASLAEV